jgi:uncharacterized protein
MNLNIGFRPTAAVSVLLPERLLLTQPRRFRPAVVPKLPNYRALKPILNYVQIMSFSDRTLTLTQTPVDPLRRIEAVDMVRGFALFGVILVNMFNFGSGGLFWNEPIDEFAWSVKRFFFETKSWRLFAFLFGFGFALQLIRATECGAKFTPIYIRRLVILFIFGAVHAVIYDGDILMHYAELGLVLMLFRNVQPKLLLVLSVCLLAVFPVGRAVTSFMEPTQTAPTADYVVRLEAAKVEMEEYRTTHPYAVGSIRDVIAENAHLKNPFRRLLGPESSLAVFAMFLLGLYTGRRGIFNDIPKHLDLIRRVFWWGLTVGLACMGAERILNARTGYEVFGEQQATFLPQLFGDVLFAYGSTLLALGYAAGITLLAHNDRGKWLLAPFGAAGRMALTVYISASVMFGALFYNFAFGKAFYLGPAPVTGYAIIFFAILILFAVWWTSRFRFGPMEWLWRALTYGKLPPMRLKDRSHVQS